MSLNHSIRAQWYYYEIVHEAEKGTRTLRCCVAAEIVGFKTCCIIERPLECVVRSPTNEIRWFIIRYPYLKLNPAIPFVLVGGLINIVVMSIPNLLSFHNIHNKFAPKTVQVDTLWIKIRSLKICAPTLLGVISGN